MKHPTGSVASGFRDGVWLNEPEGWSLQEGTLTVVTGQNTDFWRETHYGFVRDSGHFLGIRTGAAFTAQFRVRGHYERLYDQAGIMVRIDAERWVKAGIEHADGQALLGSVLTNGRSDWATGAYGKDPGDFWIRATVQAGVLRLQASADGLSWPLLRLAPFVQAASYLVGPMCCTPQGSGLQVRFSDFSLGLPLGKDLHDLS